MRARYQQYGWLVAVVLTVWAGGGPGRVAAQTKPAGTMTWALHCSITPTFFDPAEASGIATPFKFLYALHDALLKPMPQGLLTPSLAETWTESPDGLVYEFTLRQGLTFHNGDPLTAEDVVFSFQRYKGAGATSCKEKVQAVEVVDAHHVRFRLREPWPDFLVFLGTPATGAGLVVPKKYLERVGDDGFKQHPIGAGPYKFVSQTPGLELVLEANETYWRQIPSVKRLVFKSVPEATTRLENYVVSWAEFAYGGDPDLDALFQKQARERDPKQREALLHALQRLVHERVMFAPIFEIAGLSGIGPRVAESGLGLIPTYNWSGPYEEVRLKP